MTQLDVGKGRVIKSVADVHYFNQNDEIIAIGTALSSSAITTEVQESVVNGGYLNPEILDFKFGRTLSLTATSVTFKPEYLALNLGTEFSDVASEKYAYAEPHTIVGGKITLKHMPTSGNVLITQGEEIISNDFAVGQEITIMGKEDGEQVSVAYFYGKNVSGEETSTIEISTEKEPMTVKAVVTFHYQETATSNEGLYQVTIPRLKLSGNVTLDLAADGTSTIEMGGKGLTFLKDNGETILATWTVIPQVSSTEALETIIIQPANIMLGVGEAVTARAIAVYNTGRKTLLAPADVTFTSSDAGVATIGADGLITAIAEGLTVIEAVKDGAEGQAIVEVE